MVIRNRKALDEMMTLRPYTGMMGTAPCAILVMDDQEATDLDECLYCDCSAAIQNILMETRHRGLLTCWCVMRPRKERINNFRSYYKLKGDLLPVVVIVVGYGREDGETADRLDPDRISYFG